jgi:hypothetical protein
LDTAEARLNEVLRQADIRWVEDKTPLNLSDFIGRAERAHTVDYYIYTGMYELAPYILKKVVVQSCG